jgi:hypothetical protein
MVEFVMPPVLLFGMSGLIEFGFLLNYYSISSTGATRPLRRE